MPFTISTSFAFPSSFLRYSCATSHFLATYSNHARPQNASERCPQELCARDHLEPVAMAAERATKHSLLRYSTYLWDTRKSLPQTHDDLSATLLCAGTD